MAKSKNSNKGMIFGTVLGAVAGAAYAMWKTPMSGKELRGKLGTGPASSANSTTTSAPAATTDNGGGITDKVMGAVERTLAPIVGVDLGKTANNGGSGSTSETGPINVAGDIAPPTEVVASADGTPIADPAKGEAAMPVGEDSIRMKKFAWGTPAPEADSQDAPIQAEENAPVEPVKDATTVPAAETVGVSNEDTTSGGSWNSNSIRSQRFAWGDPKPDSAEAAVEAPMAGSNAAPQQQTTESTATASTGSDSVGSSNVDDTIVASASSVSTGKMHPFPKLGGIENNS